MQTMMNKTMMRLMLFTMELLYLLCLERQRGRFLYYMLKKDVNTIKISE